MIGVYFGEINTGRLKRLPYLGYGLLITVALFILMFAFVVMIAGAESIIGGDFSETQRRLTDMFGIPVIVLFVILFLGFLFASANLMAKRARDIGWPGWWTVLAVFAATVVISFMFSETMANILNFIIILPFLFIPSDKFERKNVT